MSWQHPGFNPTVKLVISGILPLRQQDEILRIEIFRMLRILTHSPSPSVQLIQRFSSPLRGCQGDYRPGLLDGHRLTGSTPPEVCVKGDTDEGVKADSDRRAPLSGRSIEGFGKPERVRHDFSLCSI